MATRNQTLGNRRANRRLRQASATLRSNRQVRRSRRTLLRVVARRRPLQVALATLAVITRNETQQLIAGVAYYAMVALAPVTAGMLQIFGLLLGAERAQQLFAHVAAELLPVDINVGALVAPQDSTQAGVTGLVILAWLAWGSFRLFAAIALVINYVWDITPAQVGFVGKFREFLLLSAVSLALLVSTLLTNIIAHAVVPSVMAELGMMAGARALDEQHWWSFALAWPLSALAFLLVYRYLPERPVHWRWAIVGALLATVAFNLMNEGFSFFLANVAPSYLLYWPLATGLTFLIWIFLSSLTITAGATVTAFMQSIYESDGPTPGPGWFLDNGRRHH